MACEARDSSACNWTSQLDFMGKGIEKSDENGMEFLTRACDLGTQHGTGVSRDMEKGAHYLEQACDGGVSPACEQLQHE